MALSSIKIPKKVYVGFQGRRSQDEVPLGFMTPHGDDQAAQKRMGTVDTWAKGYGYGREKTFNSVTLDNIPMIGFKVGRAIRRHSRYSGTTAKVRVEDPRGFELEISIENLVMCMAGTLFQDGEIMQECVWGRDGNNNILLPTNSEPYRESLDTAEKISNKVSLKDVKPGDTIRLLDQNELEGVYLGSWFPVIRKRDWGAHGGSKYTVEIGNNKRYVIKTKDDKGKVMYKGFASLKVGAITATVDEKLAPTTILAEMSDALKKNAACCYDNSAGYYGECKGFVASAKKAELLPERVTVTEAELDDLFNAQLNVHYGYKNGITDVTLMGTDVKGRTIKIDYNGNFDGRMQSATALSSYHKRVYNSYDPAHVRSKSTYWYGNHGVQMEALGYIVDDATFPTGAEGIAITEKTTRDMPVSDLKELFVCRYTIKTEHGDIQTLI